MEFELDHSLAQEVLPGNLHEDVGLLGRRGGELDHQCRVEPFQGGARAGAVGLVALVEDDEGLEHAQRVAERGLDLAAPETGLALESVEIGHAPEQGGVGGGIVFAREKRVVAAAVLEHAEGLLGLPVGRGQHEEEDAEVFRDVGGGEAAGLFEDEGAAGGGEVEGLAVGVVAVFQRAERLLVDLRGRHDPEHEAGLAAAVVDLDKVDDLGGEEGLASSGGDLEAGDGERGARPGLARNVGARAAGLDLRLRGEIETLGQLGVHVAQFGVLRARGVQRLQPSLHGVEGAALVAFQEHEEPLSETGATEIEYGLVQCQFLEERGFVLYDWVG